MMNVFVPMPEREAERGAGGLPGPCEGPYGTIRQFDVDGVSLYVPDMFVDRMLRQMINQGMRIDDAYAQMGLLELAPPPGMKVCCKDALRTLDYDPDTGESRLSGWGYTCSEYWDCFVRYVNALRQSRKRGRIVIAQGIYAPSPDEEACIKQKWLTNGDIVKSYGQCYASDILPTFPGAIDGLNQIFGTPGKITSPLYAMIKTLYDLASLEARHSAPVPGHTPPLPGHTPPLPGHAGWKELSEGLGMGRGGKALLYAGIGLAAYLIIKK